MSFVHPLDKNSLFHISWDNSANESLKVSSHDPILGSSYFLALSQLIEMFIRATNFVEFE